MRKYGWIRSSLVVGTLASGAFLATGLWATGQCRGAEDPPAKVAALIGELGSPHYATRERAANELSQLGLEAFDALHAAQNNDDIEIAERARYILHSMKVVWSRSNDSADVKRLLKDYGRQSEAERLSRIVQLGALDDAAGLDALCRLVRYELSLPLAKEAALVLVSNSQFAEPQYRQALSDSIALQIRNSQRAPARWLSTYLRTLEDPAAEVANWQQLIRAEQQLLAQGSSEPDAITSNKIVRGLWRWHAEYLKKLGRDEEAFQAMRETIALMDDKREQLVEIIDWLMQQKAWVVVDELAEKQPASFAEEPFLLYLLAEAQAEQGNKEKSEKTAQQAFEIAPMETSRHLIVAYSLQERGRFAWSEREYRGVISGSEMISREGLDARSMLAEMLHDQQRDKEAAAALADAVKAIEADPMVADNVNNVSRRSPAELRSRMHYFVSLDHSSRNEFDLAKQALQKGVDANQEDADLLIAMFQLPTDDKAWKKKTGELIDKAADGFKGMIEQMQRLTDETDQESHLSEAKNMQAMFCNQYAWLVGNSQGDVQDAIRMSKRSLEIRPEAAGYMDTLAHCYYRAGEYENAVKWQAKAFKLDPHSGQISRMLAKFEKALAESKAKPAN